MARKLGATRIIIAGGGTAGHVAPALAVADELVKQGCQVAFIGSIAGPEGELVEQAGYQFFAIQAGKLRRYLDWQNISDIFRTIAGFWQARSLLIQYRPSVVFAKGGYVSVPVAFAAHWLRIPVVAHESDVVIGLANWLIAEKAQLICTGFPVAVYPGLLHSKLLYTGSPVRKIFLNPQKDLTPALKQFQLKKGRPLITVIGGSQGAQPINHLIFEILPQLLTRYQVLHLVGPAHIEAAEIKKGSLPPQLQPYYRPEAYIGEELASLLTAADIVISRAGANTLAELAILGKPTIIIPLPSAASDHQRANAQVFAKKKAAVVLEQDGLTGPQLLKKIEELMADKEGRAYLSRAIKGLSSPQSAKIIAEAICRLSNS